MPNEKRLSVAYLITPLIAVALASPWQLMMPPPWAPVPDQTPSWLRYAFIPFWFGLAACPGYVYVWSERWRVRAPGRCTASWLHLSLAGAVAASAIGTAYMLLAAAVFAVFPGISAFLALHLWIRFWRARSSS